MSRSCWMRFEDIIADGQTCSGNFVFSLLSRSSSSISSKSLPVTSRSLIATILSISRYMVMEVFLDPNRDISGGDPIVITQFNVSRAIKDSILQNFGECGLASSLGSFQVKYVNPITKLCIIRVSREDYQKVHASITLVKRIGSCPVSFNLLDLSGNVVACRRAALKCDEAKFEQYKLLAGDQLQADGDISRHMQNNLDKIKILEH